MMIVDHYQAGLDPQCTFGTDSKLLRLRNFVSILINFILTKTMPF